MRIRMVQRTAKTRRGAAARGIPERVPFDGRGAAGVENRSHELLERLAEPAGRIEHFDQVPQLVPQARDVVHFLLFEHADAATDAWNLKLNELHAAIPDERR